MQRLRKVSMLFGASLLAGCMASTRVVEQYDDDCQIVTRKVLMNDGEWLTLSCKNTAECVANLAGMGLVSAASYVVAGSVVVVGNTVYWLEKQGHCARKVPEA